MTSSAVTVVSSVVVTLLVAIKLPVNLGLKGIIIWLIAFITGAIVSQNFFSEEEKK